MKTRGWLKLGGFALCAAAFGWIAGNLGSDWLNGLDLSVTKWFAEHRLAPLTAFMKGVTLLCHPVTLLLICLALMYVYRKHHYSIPIAINLMVSVSLNYTLKNVFLRLRPPLIYRAVAETGYSFPSGHAMAAGAFYGFLIYIVWQSGLSRGLKRTLITLLTAIIALVGLSRVYLGVHYASDVIAGLAVSIAYLLVYSQVVGLYLRSGRTASVSVPEGAKSKSILDSFTHAADGIVGGMRGERNMIIHFAAMALVTVFGFLCAISEAEWLTCIVLFGLVIGMELINTAIETTVNICMPHRDPRAKLAKDTSAGAVLAVSVAAAIAGAVIFIPKLWPMLS